MTLEEVDIAVIGGGLGGVAAALAALRQGWTVLLSEETEWLGGQLTAQAVPPDEHPWIEQFGCTKSYRALRDGIRAYYRSWYPLTAEAYNDRWLNPGAGRVSKLCHEPRVGLAVIEAMLAPYRATGRLRVRTGCRPVAADVDGDRVRSVLLRDAAGDTAEVTAGYVLDATETGELLPLTGTEYVTGFEAAAETSEPHGAAQAQPLNMQAVSVCLVVDHRAGEDHTIDRPANYAFWRDYQPSYWPDRLLSWTAPDPRTLEPVTRQFLPNPDDRSAHMFADQSKDAGDKELWTFRRIAARRTFTEGFLASDTCLVNWPMIDYLAGPIFEVDDAEAARHVAGARELSLSMLYWMQTEAPRADGGTGFPGLRPRGDLIGTTDGLALAPYVRESRRIRAKYTVVEQDLSLTVRGNHGAVRYEDSVGVGSYRIDLHPSTGGDNYIDVAGSPFEIPLRSLVPVRMRNLLPAAKNIGTTHITNGCYRLHPVEWNIGEVAGTLAAFCLSDGHTPEEVADKPEVFAELQRLLHHVGVETRWPEIEGY
ncbi:MAG: FAD-dependent oxidoreductase [Streptosporangiales bacterium]|nr:FAD-dependent oxidoreductase [Streptosporangiales bacterium]